MSVSPALRGILKIEGPPGSGKTRQLIREACRLIAQDGVAAERIVLLAVSKANKWRLQSFLKEECRLAGLPEPLAIRCQTLDEFALWLLRELDNPDIAQLPEAEAQIILHEIVRQVILPGESLYSASRQFSFARVVFELIRQFQLLGVTPEMLSARIQDQPEAKRLRLMAEIYQVFDEKIRSQNLLSHASLVTQAWRKLEAAGDDEKARLSGFDVLMVDEAQELSESAHRIFSCLAVSLVFAGNEHFSIRSYRAARPNLLSQLSSIYGERPVTLFPQLSCFRGNEPILSLLNHFLPAPVWESHELDAHRLAEGFCYETYADPETEVEQIAREIRRRVDAGARFEDCVILLRSARYKGHLLQALALHDIPFRAENLSEKSVRVQHALFDLLTVLADLQRLPLPENQPLDSGTLRSAFEKWQAPTMEKQNWLERHNRHLQRWVEAALFTEEPADQSQKANPSLNEPKNSEKLPFRLAEWLESLSECPMSEEPFRCLFTFYGQYQVNRDVVEVFDAFSSFWQAKNKEPETERNDLLAYRENLRRLADIYQTVLGRSVTLADWLSRYQALWEEIEPEPEPGATIQSKVQILSIRQFQGNEAPYVFIPFLVHGEFPMNRLMPELVSESEQALINVPMSYRIDEAEEGRLLALGMTRASGRVYISTHQADEDQSVLPSPFFTVLSDEAEKILGALSSDLSVSDIKPEESNEPDAPAFYAAGLWGKLNKQSPEPLFEASEEIRLSASSIKTYMNCPRQFYYRHLLGLKMSESLSATLGQLIHRLMEVLNRQASRKEPTSFTATRLTELAEVMFAFASEPDAFESAGFSAKDRQMLEQLPPLTLSNLKVRVMASIQDLEDKGYFRRYSGFRMIEAEKSLEDIRLPGVSRCRFTGKIDALIQQADGRWDLIDYKTFRNAYGTAGAETCQKHFLDTLAPLPDDESLDHASRFTAKLSASYPKDYQLPLYFLACQEEHVYRDQLSGVAMQIIRPASPDKPDQGAIRLEIPASDILEQGTRMLSDIQRYIVEPILDCPDFETAPSEGSCAHCDYSGICDVSGEPLEGES